MLILDNPINLYGRKVIVDLLSRKGEPTPDTTLYNGMSKVFAKWTNIINPEELSAPLDYIFAMEEDFDADKRQPKQFRLDEFDEDRFLEDEHGEVGKEYQATESDPFEFSDYYRRLEDIHPRYLENYIGNVVYRYAYQSTEGNSLSAMRKIHRLQPTLVDINDDEETEYADTVTAPNTDRATNAEIEYANDNIGYTIKRLHNLGRQLGIHIISYIGAYERAKLSNERKRQANSVKTLTSNDVVAKGVYLCDGYGNATKRLEVKNKNVHAAEAFAWITNNDQTYSAYLKDYYAFLHYCEVLSIDIMNDMTLHKIGTNVVNSLVIKTVTPNQQYNEQIFKALKENNPTIKVTEDTTADLIELTVSLVEGACSVASTDNLFYNIVNQYVNFTPEQAKQYGLALYEEIIKMQYPTFKLDMSKVSWREGYLHYYDNLVILNTDFIRPNTNFTENRFLISELGVIVKLADTTKLVYMLTELALYNLNKRKAPTENTVYTDWSVR